MPIQWTCTTLYCCNMLCCATGMRYLHCVPHCATGDTHSLAASDIRILPTANPELMLPNLPCRQRIRNGFTLGQNPFVMSRPQTVDTTSRVRDFLKHIQL